MPAIKKKRKNGRQTPLNAFKILNGVFSLLIVIILYTLVHAATPNPGHPWTEVGDGAWGAAGPTAYRTFTFPDATATVMTTLDVHQGDLIYGSAASTTSSLPLDANATRYLSNTGTSNNPAWSAINLINGISGILPIGNGGTGSTFVGFTGPTAGRTFTLPDATSTILTTNALVSVSQGGTGASTISTNGLVVGNNTSPVTTIPPGANGSVLLVDSGASTSSPITSPFWVNGRRQFLVAANAGVATVSTFNGTAATLSGNTQASADDTNGPFFSATTKNTSGNPGGIAAGTFNTVSFGWDPDFFTRMKTDATTVTGVRYWIGLFSATPDLSTTPAVSAVGFLYDAATSGFWQTVTCTTTCVGAGETVTTTSVAVTANTLYTLRFTCTPASCKFYINDNLVATHTTTLPSQTQLLGYSAHINNTSNGTVSIRVSHISIVHDN